LVRFRRSWFSSVRSRTEITFYSVVVFGIIIAAVFVFLRWLCRSFIEGLLADGKGIGFLVGYGKFRLRSGHGGLLVVGRGFYGFAFWLFEDYIPYLAFVIPTFSGLRLAKFNIDERQTTSFIGLPVPAHALFWASVGYSVLPVVHANEGLFVLVTVILAFITSLLLVSEIPMFSLKVKSLAWKGNELRYILIACAIIFVALWGFLGISGTILLYIVLSIFNKKG